MEGVRQNREVSPDISLGGEATHEPWHLTVQLSSRQVKRANWGAVIVSLMSDCR